MATSSVKNNGILPLFRGEPKEDAKEWTRKAGFVIKLQELDEKSALKAIGMSLIGKAFDWFIDTVEKNPGVSYIQILQELEFRFLSGVKDNEIAQRFLTSEIPATAEDFFEMIKDGRVLADNQYMSIRAVAENISKRAPSEIRIALWETKTRIETFDQFTKAAERAVPLSYNNDGTRYANSMEINQGSNFVQKYKSTSNNKKSMCTTWAMPTLLRRM